jgi:hypothetical protein
MLHKSFNSFVLVITILMLFTSMAYAQVHNKKKAADNFSISYVSDRQFTDQEIGNLITGIKSENLGLRKSAIYFSGLYGVSEAVPALIDQLKIEENAEVKVLTALVLLRLEDPRGIDAIENLYKNDENARVRRMSKAILAEFRKNLAVTEVSER